jgi:hypothetical protein
MLEEEQGNQIYRDGARSGQSWRLQMGRPVREAGGGCDAEEPKRKEVDEERALRGG